MSMDAPPPPPPPAMGGTGSAPTAPLGNPLVGYWKQVVLERYAQFTGRARRAEYWWFSLATLIVGVVLSVLGAVSSIFLILYYVYALAVLIPSLAVGVRRLHDTGRSGWWLLIALVPIVGVIVLIVFFATDSKPGTNQYGTSEKYPVG
ncbi:MAG: hypothetical protein QOF40_1783 [Actinomycetota bacterium]|nr:hypothetical protein [Actinomycetota bacterium]